MVNFYKRAEASTKLKDEQKLLNMYKSSLFLLIKIGGYRDSQSNITSHRSLKW